VALKILTTVALIVFSISANALTLHLSPTGDDSAAGTAVAPLATLHEAHRRLVASPPGESVTIQLESGTYSQPSRLSWTYSNPSYATVIRGISRASTVIDGGGLADDWLRVATPLGQNANIHVTSLTIKNYLHAISVKGSPTDINGWIGNVRVYSAGLDYIGGKHSSGIGYGAVRFVNVRNGKILNNRIRYTENITRPELIHGVYLAHFSKNNTVSGNEFYKISGDPIRVRDRSDYNIIESNLLTHAGADAIYGDWYDVDDECPSQGNVLRDNSAGNSGYSGSSIPLFVYFGSDGHCGQLKEPRLRTSGNTRF
jgi:hypothetical protein